jgi:hypothetical protein
VKNMTGAPEAIKQYLEEQQIELNSWAVEQLFGS